MTREVMEYDVLVVGAGPSGLAAAIRLKQLAAAAGKEISVCIIEKGAEVGAHLLSGAVLEPRALEELFPDYKERGAPLETPVQEDKFYFLTKGSAVRLPTPPQMHNEGNFIISLGAVAKWMAQQAEALGVEIYAGFAGAEVLYDEHGHVVGVATGDMGVAKDGSHKPDYTPGVELRAKQTVFAEGARGSLTKTIIKKFALDAGKQPQTYSLGVKEIWEIAPEKFRAGRVIHTIGWPLDSSTYGGGWCYHFGANKVSIGFVTGLDYTNPYLSPYEEMQRYKTHPLFAELLKGGRRINYGARAIVTGGLQALPKLTFPGGLLVGDTAGFLNVPKIKGNHTAMKSGILAAEAIFEQIFNSDGLGEVVSYAQRFERSWLMNELSRVRNIKPAFKWGLWAALIYGAIDTYILRGRAPWTLPTKAVHTTLKKAKDVKPIVYPKPDGVLTFDRLTSVSLTNTFHAEDQPVHLQLVRGGAVMVDVNNKVYDSPETRYCPAGVYEFVDGKFHINAQNCIHCKTCDIKDPTQNINWVVPEGSGGPNYGEM
ncbi:MAG: electron transfer flavoprotein-ubiquinone oxidoreductase [Bdellovibrionales bacterium]